MGGQGGVRVAEQPLTQVRDELRDPAVRAGDHRQARRSRLQRGDPERLQLGGREVDRAPGQLAPDLRPVEATGQLDPVLHPVPAYEPLERGSLRSVADDDGAQRLVVGQPASYVEQDPRQGQRPLGVGQSHHAHDGQRVGGLGDAVSPEVRVDRVGQDPDRDVGAEHRAQWCGCGGADGGPRDRPGAQTEHEVGRRGQRPEPRPHRVHGDHGREAHRRRPPGGHGRERRQDRDVHVDDVGGEVVEGLPQVGDPADPVHPGIVGEVATRRRGEDPGVVAGVALMPDQVAQVQLDAAEPRPVAVAHVEDAHHATSSRRRSHNHATSPIPPTGISRPKVSAR